MLSVGGGTVAIASLPGRSGTYQQDMQSFREFMPSLVLTMVTEAELTDTGAVSFGIDIQSMGSRWFHLPVMDYCAPATDTAMLWPDASTAARSALAGGGRVLVHCKAGCGRSGMAVLRLMVDSGEDPSEALKRLRAVRPCAVETDVQMTWARAGF
ncbi:dual specificity protein phosphatase family protein [Lentibacter algarum]|nr:dual specificity protein phosphatase family protein [Lentibacter algarum]MBU2981514.1 dual specificity protein phosphatase family protein [Lentibacter algarum]